jgi:hypothetical protein
MTEETEKASTAAHQRLAWLVSQEPEKIIVNRTERREVRLMGCE